MCIPRFVNVYSDSTFLYHMVADKSLIHYDADPLGDHQFYFELKPVGDNAAIAPMPVHTVGTGADRTLTVSNIDKAVRFFENTNDGLFFSLNGLHNLGFDDDDLEAGVNFEYEMREVIQTGAVFNNNGSYTYSKNADGVTTYYDAVVHHRTLQAKLVYEGDVYRLVVNNISDPARMAYFATNTVSSKAAIVMIFLIYCFISCNTILYSTSFT